MRYYNYWLFSTRRLEKIVEMIQEGMLVERDVWFVEFIDHISYHISRHLKYELNKEVIQECREICYLKVYKYDPTAGKAFNYFTTIILGHLRQVRRRDR